MFYTNFLLFGLLACEDNFDKGGEELSTEPPANEQEDIPTDPVDRIELEDQDHDWDLDGFTEDEGDCDDDNANIHPDAEEIYYDNTDQNCDGQHDYDADGDGYLSLDWGGEDCNDNDETIHPEASHPQTFHP